MTQLRWRGKAATGVALCKSADAAGHEHKPAGAGGGQFTGTGGSGTENSPKINQSAVVHRIEKGQLSYQLLRDGTVYVHSVGGGLQQIAHPDGTTIYDAPEYDAMIAELRRTAPRAKPVPATPSVQGSDKTKTLSPEMQRLRDYALSLKEGEKPSAIAAAAAMLGKKPESVKELNSVVPILRQHGFRDVSDAVTFLSGKLPAKPLTAADRLTRLRRKFYVGPAMKSFARLRFRPATKSCCAGCGCCDACAVSDPLAILDQRGPMAPAGLSYKFAPGMLALDSPVLGEHRFDDKAMAITYVFAAAQGRDRGGDYMEIGPTDQGEGILTANHERNAVAYVEHGQKFFPLPIGYDRVRVEDAFTGPYTVGLDAERGLATCTTYLTQSRPEGEQVYHMYREGLLRGGSIGYRPIKSLRLGAEPREGHHIDPKKGHAGLHLLTVELLETTLTGMPMNADAVRRSLEMGCCGRPLAPGLKSMLMAKATPAPVWANGFTPARKADAAGHEHKPAGAGGGQFTSADGGGAGGSEAAKPATAPTQESAASGGGDAAPAALSHKERHKEEKKTLLRRHRLEERALEKQGDRESAVIERRQESETRTVARVREKEDDAFGKELDRVEQDLDRRHSKEEETIEKTHDRAVAQIERETKNDPAERKRRLTEHDEQMGREYDQCVQRQEAQRAQRDREEAQAWLDYRARVEPLRAADDKERNARHQQERDTSAADYGRREKELWERQQQEEDDLGDRHRAERRHSAAPAPNDLAEKKNCGRLRFKTQSFVNGFASARKTADAPSLLAVEKHEFSSTQFNLPEPLASAVRRLAEAIPDTDLAEDDREQVPHITCLFGLHTDDVEEVKAVVRAEVSVLVTLGETSFFPAKGGAQHDVVEIDVESAGLRRLHDLMGERLEYTATHPVYRPHITLGYVVPGKGASHAGPNPLTGRTALLDRLLFFGKDGTRAEIRLRGPAGAKRSLAAAPPAIGRKSTGHETAHAPAGAPDSTGGQFTAGGGGGAGKKAPAKRLRVVAKDKLSPADKEKAKADKAAAKEKAKADKLAAKEKATADKEKARTEKTAEKEKAKTEKIAAKEKAKTEKAAAKEKLKADKLAVKEKAKAAKTVKKVTVDEAHEHLKGLLAGKGELSASEQTAAADKLMSLTVPQLKELAGRLGVKASGVKKVVVDKMLAGIVDTTDLGAALVPPIPALPVARRQEVTDTGPIKIEHVRAAFDRHRKNYPGPSAAARSAASEANLALEKAGGRVADLATAVAVGAPILAYIDQQTAGLTREVAELAAAVKKAKKQGLYDAYDKAHRALVTKQGDLGEARSEAAAEAIRATRSVGASEDFQPRVAGDGHKTLDHFAAASAMIPTDWLEKSNKHGKLSLEKSTAGGMGGGSYKRKEQVLAASGDSVAMHEFIHRMQDAYPEIATVEGELFAKKTAGKKKNAVAGMGYYSGAFKNPYASRWDQGRPGEEVATITAESLFYGRGRDQEEADTSAAVLGLFAGVGRLDVKAAPAAKGVVPEPIAPPKKSGFFSRLFGG